MILILCGLPKSGKSTIGAQVAQELSIPFIDSDHLIETSYFNLKNQRLSCREIVKIEGELFFRLLEKEQLQQTAFTSPALIALGGGSLEDPRTIEILAKQGLFIYLKTPLHIIWERIYQTGLPSYLKTEDPKMEFYKIAHKRTLEYEKIAQWSIETEGMNENEVTNQILQKYRVNNG